MFRLRIGTTFISLCLLAPGAGAQDAACEQPRIVTADGCLFRAQAGEGVKRILDGVSEEFGLTASIYRVSVDGAALVTGAWGNSLTGVPATPDMHFRIGAVAIPYLSIVTLRLREMGMLTLDEPIAKWLPDMPKAGQVTVRMLVTNTSGYPDYVDLAVLPLFENPFRQWTPAELMQIAFTDRDLACDPGACFTYAHTNYVVLGEVLAKATGRPVADLIKEYVLDPLGLRNTRSDQTARIPEPVLHGYSAEREDFEASTDWSPSWTLAEGSIMTGDIYDVERSAIGIGTGALISKADYEMMIAPLPGNLGRAPNGLYYGYGVVMNNGWITQSPSFFGYYGFMAYHPASGIAIAFAATDGPASPPRPNFAAFERVGTYLLPESPPFDPTGQ
jgi:D-alanyl-D-alanine carboxypeptidase